MHTPSRAGPDRAERSRRAGGRRTAVPRARQAAPPAAELDQGTRHSEHRSGARNSQRRHERERRRRWQRVMDRINGHTEKPRAGTSLDRPDKERRGSEGNRRKNTANRRDGSSAVPDQTDAGRDKPPMTRYRANIVLGLALRDSLTRYSEMTSISMPDMVYRVSCCITPREDIPFYQTS